MHDTDNSSVKSQLSYDTYVDLIQGTWVRQLRDFFNIWPSLPRWRFLRLHRLRESLWENFPRTVPRGSILYLRVQLNGVAVPLNKTPTSPIICFTVSPLKLKNFVNKPIPESPLQTYIDFQLKANKIHDSLCLFINNFR